MNEGYEENLVLKKEEKKIVTIVNHFHSMLLAYRIWLQFMIKIALSNKWTFKIICFNMKRECKHNISKKNI